MRICVLFQRDLEKIKKLLLSSFEVISEEDVSVRLNESQFGYQSLHLQIRLKDEWLTIPTYADLGGMVAEVQLRTLAQHIWAAASHKLQYKQEASVPQPIRRSINRVSALLETVDLEFSRVLDERDNYIALKFQNDSEEILNVDSLRKILDEKLPNKNKSGDEDYADLLGNLIDLEISTRRRLLQLIADRLTAAIESDSKAVKEILSGSGEEYLFDFDHVESKGIFYSHAGLVREMLLAAFGSEELARVTAEDDTDW